MIDNHLYKPLILISCAVWMGFLSLYTLFWLIEGALPPDLSLRVLVYTVSTGLTFVAGVLTFRILAAIAPWRWPAVFLLAVTTLLVHSVISSTISITLLPGEVLERIRFFQIFSTAMIYDSPIVSSAFIGFIAIHYGQQSAKQQRLVLEMDNAARDAQLAALRHQLNPHFLFNTLNSISALVSEGEAENAEKTILLLSDFLRFSLDSDPVELIPLKDELANVSKYLEIEKVRYEDRLRVDVKVDEAARAWPVPPFMVQPILENVIKHAVSRVEHQVSVMIVCTVIADDLAVIVEDDGPGPAAPTNQSMETGGTGLRNLKKRLNLIYGSRANISAGARLQQGMRVQISIAKRGGSHA